MIQKCALCNREFGEIYIQKHHIIPENGIIELLNININPDLYRIFLCKDCHEKVTEEWMKVETVIRRLKGNHDEWFSQWFGDENWSLISIMKLGHLIDHNEFDCPECNKPMQMLWINQLIASGIEEGKRNITRYKIMISLQKKGLERNEILDKILEFNKNCRPPEEEKIVRYHVESTFKKWDRNGI